MRLRVLHKKLVALSTPLWMEIAWKRGLVELEQLHPGAAEVFGVDEAHLKLTEAGREKLAEIERDWPLVPLAGAAQARSWVLESAFNLIIAIAGASLITVTAAVGNLRRAPIAWVALVLLFGVLFYAFWRRWQRVQRTRRAYHYYWLYRGNQRKFKRAEKKAATDLTHIQEYADSLSRQMDLDSRVTHHRVRELEEKHDAERRKIAAWRDATLQEIRQKYETESEAASDQAEMQDGG